MLVALKSNTECEKADVCLTGSKARPLLSNKTQGETRYFYTNILKITWFYNFKCIRKAQELLEMEFNTV